MNRRGFLKQGGLAAGAALPLISGARALADERGHTPPVAPAGTHRRVPNILAGLDPFTGPLTKDLAMHLLRRTGFGPQYAEATALVGGDAAQIVDAILADQAAPAPPTTWDPTAEPDFTQPAQTTNRANLGLYRNWWMDIMYTSTNPLIEKMVLFWANHFVSEGAKVTIPQFLYWQNVLFRRSALGDFKQFVKDVTIDNAMVWYLDGYTNTKNRPNENYARELMELFTIGPFDSTNLLDPTKAPVPNYSETDIQQAARALTGWKFVTAGTLSDTTTATFHGGDFDNGADKIFLDANPGDLQYGDIVDTIFTQVDQPTGKNKVALFICTKLYAHFVYADTGDPKDTTVPYNQLCNATNPIIQSMADTFVANNFSIRPVLRQLLTSQHFFDQSVVGANIKSPVQFMISATRQVGNTSASDSYLVQQANGLAGSGLSQLNQPPNVKGFPGYRTWISTASLPSRNQISDQLISTGPIDFIAFAKLVGDNDPAIYDTASKLVAALAEFLFPFAPSQSEITDLTGVLLASGETESDWSTGYPNADKEIQNLVAVMMRFAEFQLA